MVRSTLLPICLQGAPSGKTGGSSSLHGGGVFGPLELRSKSSIWNKVGFGLPWFLMFYTMVFSIFLWVDRIYWKEANFCPHLGVFCWKIHQTDSRKILNAKIIKDYLSSNRVSDNYLHLQGLLGSQRQKFQIDRHIENGRLKNTWPNCSCQFC